MDVQEFRKSLQSEEPPQGLSTALRALWWDANGNWEKAHELAQERDDPAGMLVHAFLHRKEGDPSNAAYWYRRAGHSPSTASLEEEWQTLVGTFLAP